MTRVVHLSDLHLGNDFVLRSAWRRRRWWRAEDERVLKALADCLRTLHPRPAYVVISGDIVNKCTAATMEKAAATVRRLFQDADIDLYTKLLIIPGNHDVPVFAEENKYFARVREFVEFLKELFGEDNYRTRTERFVRIDHTAGICFFCLDTTLKAEQPIAEGSLGPAQLKWAKHKYDEFMSAHPQFGRYVKIVVMHHHPYPILASGHDRFMQLQDAADAEKMFEHIAANVVLHGHKHFAHVTPRLLVARGSHPLTVIGAGTACCPFPDEQAGQGNSFNCLDVDGDTNVLKIDRFRLTENGFELDKSESYPIFKPSGRGYKMKVFRSIYKILNLAGACSTTDHRLGLVADEPQGDGIRHIRFFVSDLPTEARITSFTWDSSVERVEYEKDKNTEREKRGSFILRDPLKWGAKPVNFYHTTEIDRAFTMRAVDGTLVEESIAVEMLHPADTLVIEAEFPHGYRVSPRVSLRGPNHEKLSVTSTAHDLHMNEDLSRFTLTVQAPVLAHEYGLVWQVPT